MTWFNRLESRERFVLTLGGIILLGLFIYFSVWRPLVNSQTELKILVAAEKKNLQWMYQAAAEVRQLRERLPSESAQTKHIESLLSLIDNSAKILGKIDKWIEPQGENFVSVSMEQVGFTELIRWLGQLYKQHHIQVVSITIEKLKMADMVKVKMFLSRP